MARATVVVTVTKTFTTIDNVREGMGESTGGTGITGVVRHGESP
jgi:hypothetical protein